MKLRRIVERDPVQREVGGADGANERGLDGAAIARGERLREVPPRLRAADHELPTLPVDDAIADDPGVAAARGDQRRARAAAGAARCAGEARIARGVQRDAGVDPQRDAGRNRDRRGDERVGRGVGREPYGEPDRARIERGLDARGVELALARRRSGSHRLGGDQRRACRRDRRLGRQRGIIDRARREARTNVGSGCRYSRRASAQRNECPAYAHRSPLPTTVAGFALPRRSSRRSCASGSRPAARSRGTGRPSCQQDHSCRPRCRCRCTASARSRPAWCRARQAA